MLVLAVLAGVQNVVSPLSQLLTDEPIVLTKGDEIWRTTFHWLSSFDAWVFAAIVMSPDAVWLLCIVEIGRLALRYRRGMLFDVYVTRCYMRLGVAMTVMGVLGTAMYPALNYFFFWRGVTPWLADMPFLSIVQSDLIMAGAFFFVLGKIMRRGVELQDSFSLTV